MSLFSRIFNKSLTPHVTQPLKGEVDEAKRHPNGWVYRISGPFGPDDGVPPEAIVGAWKVNAEGEIVGEFLENKKYDPVRWPNRLLNQ